MSLLKELRHVAIRFEEKKAIVAQVNQTARKALSLVIADARGVASNDMTTLRASARDNLVDLLVVRNTLAKRALEGTEYECVKAVLKGPSLFGFSMEDPGAGARLFKSFASDNDQFVVKALSVGGNLLAADKLDVLAKLPTRDQAIAALMRTIQAPIAKLVGTVNEVPAKLVRTVVAVNEQKNQAA